MSRLSLPVVSPKSHHGKGSKRNPKVTFTMLRKLCRLVLAQKTLEGAAKLVGEFGRSIPNTPPSVDGRSGKLVQWANWSNTLERFANCLGEGRAYSSIISLEGNEKLPYATFGTLPVFTCPGAGECADWCYSFTSWRYPGPFCRQLQNTLLLKFRPELVREAFLLLPQGSTLRLYVDGDFGSYGVLAWWMDRCRERPDMQVYGYSKSWKQLMSYHRRHHGNWPANYKLNLSNGGREQGISVEEMMNLPITRGRFVSVHIDYVPKDNDGNRINGNIGFKRYIDPVYHRAVRVAAVEQGLEKVFSCPGKCGSCGGGNHACGNENFKDVVIAIGVH